MGATPIDLNGAVVAITGGGRGIGRATGELFAARGATVALGDLDAEVVADAAGELGRSVHAFALDVTSRRSFKGFLSAVEESLGPVDVLVNNAGIMPAGPFLGERERTTDAILAVNLRGVINGMRLVLPEMIDRGRGHVVNVASLLGKTELPGLATYVASKHAVVGLTAAVRAELEGTGVTLSVVMPSIVNTELASGIRLGVGRLIRVEPERVAAAIARTVETRAGEVAVPNWLALYPTLRPFIPDRLEGLVRKLVGDDKALNAVDPAVRAAYEERATGPRSRTEQ
jgi:NADP-dependent 3-hydroxy acid dehydrogenase YdfG